MVDRRSAPLLVWLAFLAACAKTGPLHPEEVPKAIERLQSASEGKRRNAEERLEATAPSLTWGPLAQLAADGKARPEARAAAVRVFEKTVTLGLPGVVSQLAGDPDPVVREEALRAILAWGDPMQATALDRAMAAVQDSSARAQLAEARGALLSGRDRWDLRQLTHGADASERLTAARSLADSAKPGDVPALIAAFHADQDQAVRQQLVLTVARVGSNGAAEFVRGELRDEDPFLRAAAAMGESSLKDRAAVAPLVMLLTTDPVGDNRVSAAQALASIGGPEASEALRRCAKGQTGSVRETCRQLLSRR